MTEFMLDIEKNEIELLRKSGVLSYLRDGSKDCDKGNGQMHDCCCLLLAATYYLAKLLQLNYKIGIMKQTHDYWMYARIYSNDKDGFPMAPQEMIAIDFIKSKTKKISEETGRREFEIFEIINAQIINTVIYMKWLNL